MKIKALISFGILVSLVQSYYSMNRNQNYNIKKNIKVSSNGLLYLIGSLQNQAFFFCLAACNSDSNCLTIVFQKSAVNSNSGICNLYSKIFKDTDLNISIGSELCEKENKIVVITSTIQALTTDSSNSTMMKTTTDSSTSTTIKSYNITELNARLLTCIIK